MSKFVKRLLVFLLILQLALPVPLFAQMAGEFVAVVGNVSVKRGGGVFKPKAKEQIHVKDVITTGEKSRTKLLMIDRSQLTLGAKSKMEIKEFNLKANTRKGLLSLSVGKLQALVEKKPAGSSFDVHTPTAVAGVRGTEWISLVEVVQNATTSSFYTLHESIAVFNTALPSQVVTVGAGNFTVVAAGVAPTIPAAFTPAMIQGLTTELGTIAPTGASGASAAGAATAGEAAGTAAAAGLGAGTIAAGAVVAGVVAAAAAQSTSSTTTTHHH